MAAIYLGEQSQLLSIKYYDFAAPVDALPFDEIVADAAEVKCSGVVIAHLQISTYPIAHEEVRETASIAHALKHISVNMIDRVVIGQKCISFRARGLLPE